MNEISKELLKVARVIASEGSVRKGRKDDREYSWSLQKEKEMEKEQFNKANVEKLVEALKKLERKNVSDYQSLMEDYRDVLPHSGKQDVMLGNLEKFKEWMGKSPEDAETMLEEVQKVLKVAGVKKAGAMVGDKFEKSALLNNGKYIMCFMRFNLSFKQFDLEMVEDAEKEITALTKKEYNHVRLMLSNGSELMVKRVQPMMTIMYNIDGNKLVAEDRFRLVFDNDEDGKIAFKKLLKEFDYKEEERAEEEDWRLQV